MAGLFTVALTFASLQLPRWAATLASRWVAVPDHHPAIEPDAVEAFLATHHLHAVGWLALAVTLVLVGVGLATRRRTPTLIGAVVLWLPVFGAFAAAMFFLAGLGVLRVLWLPLWPSAMSLGDVELYLEVVDERP